MNKIKLFKVFVLVKKKLSKIALGDIVSHGCIYIFKIQQELALNSKFLATQNIFHFSKGTLFWRANMRAN